ncbi:MAG: tetratricopeptide repeat protein, partial [Atribacterota bacterium]|nr:tetratricopeptide repeat protein [Atribacterota bacterium]
MNSTSLENIIKEGLDNRNSKSIDLSANISSEISIPVQPEPKEEPLYSEPVLRDQAIQNNSLVLEYYKKALDLKERAIQEYGGVDYPSKPLWNEAIQNATKTVELDPDFADGYYLLYEIYQKTKWIAREIESLEHYIATIRRTNKQVSLQEFSTLLTRLAHLKFNAGDTTTAVSYLEEAISYNPNNIETRNYLMEIYYNTGQTTKALQQAEEIKRIKPDSIELDWYSRRTQRINLYGREAFENYENGYNLYIAKKFQESISYLEQAIRMAPAFKDAHYYLGLSYYHSNNLISAIKHWEEAVKLDPFDTHSIIYLNKAVEEKEYGREAVWSFNEGYEHYIAGEYQEALSLFRKTVNINPNYEKARMLLMRTYYHLDQMDEYLAERKRITENVNFTGDLERELYQVAYDFFSIKEYTVALEKLQESLDINPDYLESRFLIAETWYQLGNHSEANIHYQYIISNYSQSEYYADSLLGSGWCYFLSEDYRQAENCLKLFIDNFPQSSFYQEALYKLGRTYFMQEDYHKTIETLESLINREFEQQKYSISEINFFIGQSYFWLENYGKAKEILLSIIENDPYFEMMNETKYFYSFSLFREGRYQEAISLLEELSIHADIQLQQEVNYLLGRALLEIKDYDKVIRINRSLLENDLNESMLANVLFDLGIAYSRNKNDAEAVKYFQRVLEEVPLGELAGLSKIELAQSYFYLERYVDSINVLKDISSKEALELKIDAARAMGETDLLLLSLQEYEQKYPDGSISADGYYSIAISQYNEGKYQEAYDTFKILEGMEIIDEMEQKVTYWQGLSQYKLKNYSQAKDYFQLIDYYTGNETAISALYMLAETYYQEGNYTEAIKYYQEFLENFKTNSLAETAYYGLAWSYLNNRDYLKSIETLEILIENYPDSQLVEEGYFLLGKIHFLAGENDNSRTNLIDFVN